MDGEYTSHLLQPETARKSATCVCVSKFFC